MCLISRLPFQFWFILWPRHIWMNIKEKLVWDEGIQTRFPAVLWLTRYGWFLCNMRYLYWSWYLHMCADVSCLTFWQSGWLPCALCSTAAGLTLVLQGFLNIWHIWQPKTGTPSSTPMDFYCADWKEIFHFHFMPLRIWSMKEKTCHGSVFDLGWEILGIMTWQDYTSKSSASRLFRIAQR